MSGDDLVLFLQRSLDRLVRRLRRGGAPLPSRRRLLIVQIDGLSSGVLDDALAAGRMPFLRRLLDRQGHRRAPMTVGLPTSTPAFQMATMYGVRPDIPGFHYYHRARRTDVHFPRAGHAALIEAEQAAGRRGILEGGSAYGCTFTGGAENNLFSFAMLTRPTGRGIICVLSAVVVLLWVFTKSLAMTLLELALAVLRLIADPLGQSRSGWRWLAMKVGMSVWVRELFTLAVSRDLYAGAPAVYVNYLDYDVAAHAFGPRSRRALGSLRRVDAAIRQLWRVARRVPEHQYDLYVLSDHGQAHCRPYRQISGGRPFERWVFDELLDPANAGANVAAPRRGLARGLRARSREASGVYQKFLNYLDEDFLQRSEHEAAERGGVRVITAGPNAFLYVVDTPGPLDAEALERRFPGLGEEISRSPGVGFVLARSGEGVLCFWRGKRHQLSESEPGPFAGRADAALVIRDVAGLMAMPNAGDLVIYGTGTPDGSVSFISEVGAHAGPSPDEMYTFIVHPSRVTLPSPIEHPVQLYDHFVRYVEATS